MSHVPTPCVVASSVIQSPGDRDPAPSTPRSLSGETFARIGQPVRVMGWVQQVRRLKRVSFLIVRDRRGLTQVVVDDPVLVAAVEHLGNESVVTVVGTAIASDQAPGGVEVRAASVEVVSEAATPPFDLFRPALDLPLPTLLDHAPLSLRHRRRQATLRVAAASVHGFRTALDAREFVAIQTPKLVEAAAEGGANVFPVSYFGRPAYLAQSPQLYKQIMVGVFERVYEVGPVFRAEPHDTPRHLNEYVSLDAEMGFIADHRDVMATLRDVLAGMSAAVAERAGASLDLLGIVPPEIPGVIPSIPFRDALALVSAELGEDLGGELDLAPAHERFLGEWAEREHHSAWLFVTGYPMAKRPFYTHPDPADPAASNGFDLLFRGVELVTGGQRLHRLADYEAAMASRNLDPAAFRGYLDAFRYGMPPHGGFAIGLERWVSRLLGLANVREATAFPRDLGRLQP